MEYLKNHYEKVLLILVLLALAFAAALLPMELSKVNSGEILNPSVKQKAKPLDLTTNETVLNNLKSKSETVLSGPHNLFNPVQWKRLPNGTLIKNESGDQMGPRALRVTNIRPLYFTLSLEEITGGADNRRYSIRITRVVEPNPRQRGGSPTNSTTTLAAVGEKNDYFTVIEGLPAENPTEVLVELTKGGQRVLLTKDKPFVRVDDYMADLKYPPENRPFNSVRRNDSLVFEGDTNNIVAILQNEVVLFQPSTTLRTTLKLIK
jgi:hypothetical protein